MSSNVVTPQIDHIVIKIPYKDLQNPPAWLTNNFNLAPGGRHAHGLTENKLILFADGSYLELIAFVDEDPSIKGDHWWRDHDYGFVDWALTTPKHQHQDLEEALKEIYKIDGHANYGPSQDGGRIRPDGQVVEWKIISATNLRRGIVPFWCLDVTDRELRVPGSETALLRHPCGATGIARIDLRVPTQESAQWFGGLLKSAAPIDENGRLTWSISTVVKDETSATLSVSTPAPNESLPELHSGIQSLTLFTGSEQEEDITGNYPGGPHFAFIKA